MNEGGKYNPAEGSDVSGHNDIDENNELADEKIERSFLVSGLPEKLENYDYYEVEETSSSGKPRKIYRGDSLGKGDYVKVSGIYVRKDYLEQPSHIPNKKAIRDRYEIPYEDPNLGEITIHLDIFKEPLNNKGAVMANVDFASEEDAKAFTPPDWFTEETTEEMAEDMKKGVSIFSGTLIPQRAILGEALGRLKQSDFYTKSAKTQADIKNKDFDWGQEDQRVRDFRDQVEAEKSLMEKKDGLSFDELKRGDVFIFETVRDIKFEAEKYLDRLEQRINNLQEGDPARRKMTELLNRGRVLLEYADLKPVGDGERQHDFDTLRDAISEYPDFFEAQDVSGRYRVEVTGKRKLRVRGGEKEDCLLVKMDSDSRGEDGLTARIAKKDFSLENLSESLGRIYFENVKRGGEPHAGGMSIPRIGRVYK
ncbi:MAG: hypothetical protein Q7S53_05690 [bacterium]|nr:hypothetical protein [bacterium]